MGIGLVELPVHLVQCPVDLVEDKLEGWIHGERPRIDCLRYQLLATDVLLHQQL
jgi:hypothetical protein